MARTVRIVPKPEAQRHKGLMSGQRTKRVDGTRIVTHDVGAMPLLQRIMDRMQLRELLCKHIAENDRRVRPGTHNVLCVLVANLLISREPVYGVAEWARNYAPDLFHMRQEDLEHLNDDRVGRSLDRLFEALDTGLVMAVVRQVIQEFGVSIDELHNDSTSVSLFGAYEDAQQEGNMRGHRTPAITWGHSKDHRPDLKQLLYILTVSNDGAVPVYFQTQSGNVVDDQTHQFTWNTLRELTGRSDFVYVADCKLATAENMNAIARQGGRFISLLPATRQENARFRETLMDHPEGIRWAELYQITDQHGEVIDTFYACGDEHVTSEGFRLLWISSTRKKERDAAARTRRVERALQALMKLRQRLTGSRTRFRTYAKVKEAVDKIVEEFDVAAWLSVEIDETQEESFRQSQRGRPGKDTSYTRQVQTRYTLSWTIDQQRVERSARGDGVFPMVTNLRDWSAREIVEAYKRQPIIEKRFSQFKTDFQVAPLYLKNVGRIVGLLAAYFFALIVQSLLERELRNGIATLGLPGLPIYPEGRHCVRPTARQVIDLFSTIQRHTLQQPQQEDLQLPTDLVPVHKQIVQILGMPSAHYDK